MLTEEDWFERYYAIVFDEHGSRIDRLGRPWAEHFRRVSVRLVYRRPTSGRPVIEAALFHDAMMVGGRGRQGLEAIGLSQEAITLIESITPPPNANYFRDLVNVTPQENTLYAEYIDRIILSGNEDAIYLKLADLSDTIDSISESGDDQLRPQLRDRYLPSRDRLFDWTVREKQ